MKFQFFPPPVFVDGRATTSHTQKRERGRREGECAVCPYRGNQCFAHLKLQIHSTASTRSLRSSSPSVSCWRWTSRTTSRQNLCRVFVKPWSRWNETLIASFLSGGCFTVFIEGLNSCFESNAEWNWKNSQFGVAKSAGNSFYSIAQPTFVPIVKRYFSLAKLLNFGCSVVFSFGFSCHQQLVKLCAFRKWGLQPA